MDRTFVQAFIGCVGPRSNSAHTPRLCLFQHIVMETPTTDSDGARMMGLQPMGYELGARSDEELKKLGATRRGT